MDKPEKKIFSIEELRIGQDMFNCLKDLPKAQRNVVLWVLYRHDFLDLIDSGKVMTAEEEQAWSQKAEQDRDYMLMALILYKKTKDVEREKSPS